MAIVTPEQIDMVRQKEAELINFKAPTVPQLKVGDTVRLNDGSAFAGQLVNISALDDAGRITVLMSMFGRQTRAVVTARQVERV